MEVPTFKTIIVILLTLILVYIMMTRQLSDPELLDWGFIGRNNLEEMTNYIGSSPTVIQKRNGGFAVWDKSDKNNVLTSIKYVNRIEIKDNNILVNRNPWIHVYYNKEITDSSKINEDEYISVYYSIQDMNNEFHKIKINK